MAANITTPIPSSKPSISLRSWFRVCSLSSLPPKLESLFLPMASISSIKTIHGAFSLACLKRSLTLEAPIPTNISTNSEPDIEKNGTPASPATAWASKVLPVPGGPTKRAPLGILAPISVYFPGSCRKSTISLRASLASSWPATSSKLTPVVFTYNLALLLPNDMIPPEPPILFPILLSKYLPSIQKIRKGSTQVSRKFNIGEFSIGTSLEYLAPDAFKVLTRSGSSIAPVT